jgi:nicotinamidase-related amidase
MKRTRENLYGNVPDKSPVALLLIDVINGLDFEGGRALLRQAKPMAKRLAALKARALHYGCPAIYVNDNFGRWRSEFHTQVRHCLNDKVPGRVLVELLHPTAQDYFVLKPAHSGFYSTALELLLKHLQTKTLIITGMATNSCVLFTANDAFLRGYEICIPRDCVAANSTQLSRQALKQMQTTLKADIRQSNKLPWKRWLGRRTN